MAAAMRSGTLASVVVFFQAEDGIRDIGVTGVQTCALPISQSVRIVGAIIVGERQQLGSAGQARESSAVPLSGRRHRLISRDGQRGGGGSSSERSEERRVGKEGRSRGAPYH